MNCSTLLYGQTNDTTSLKGTPDSLVVVNIATIREANIKLTERLALKEIVNQQDTIITNQKSMIDEYVNYNLYLANSNIDLQKQYNDEVKLNESLNRNLKCTKTGLYIVSGVSIAAISYIVISLLVNGK